MVVKRMHAGFLLHPGLCPGRGWTHDTKKQEGATQGPTLGQRESFSSPHPPNCLPGPERGGLSWPPEREVWKLVSGVARPTTLDCGCGQVRGLCPRIHRDTGSGQSGLAS